MNPFNATQNKIQKYYYEILSTTMTVSLQDEKGENVKTKEEGKFVNLNYFIMIVSYFKQKNETKMNQDKKKI